MIPLQRVLIIQFTFAASGVRLFLGSFHFRKAEHLTEGGGTGGGGDREKESNLSAVHLAPQILRPLGV